jgi:oligopeptide/dipeptide ABC transporter ATP-binding protein
MSARTNDTILELRDATVRFEMERGESRVLDQVDLKVRRGEVLGVVGESGSGKSMCASAMLDAIVPPGILSGEVIYYPEDGEPIDLLEIDDEELKAIRWEEISFLVQAAQSAFNPTMTIRSHFIETFDAHGADTEEGLERARELFSELYLNPDLTLQSYPHELSGGMKQRALIALSLVLEPSIIIMDEPTSALDLLMQRSIISLLSNIKETYDLTMVFVTHDLPIVSDVADRLAVMYAFEFVEIGPTSEMQHDPAHPYTRALLKSVPSITAPVDEMRPIQGSSPDPVNVPEGCSYHPRCPLADDQCVANDPGFFDASDEHRVKCFYWEQSADAIPLNIGPNRELDERT